MNTNNKLRTNIRSVIVDPKDSRFNSNSNKEKEKEKEKEKDRRK